MGKAQFQVGSVRGCKAGSRALPAYQALMELRANCNGRLCPAVLGAASVAATGSPRARPPLNPRRWYTSARTSRN